MHSLSRGPNIIIFVLLLINECITEAEDYVIGHNTGHNSHRRCSFNRFNGGYFPMKI